MTCEHKVIKCGCAPPFVGRSEVQVPFTLTNNSPFDVSYCVELASVGEANASGMQPFDCVPMEALVGAGQTRDLKLTLSADTVSLYYAANLRIVVPNQRKRWSGASKVGAGHRLCLSLTHRPRPWPLRQT